MSRAYHKTIEDIVEYAYHYEIEEQDSLAAARLALLDALGCAIETVAMSEAARRMLGPIAPGTTVPNGFRLPGTDFTLDPVKGAFDLGTLIRYLDHNDALGGTEWGHPSDNLGAILAVADWLCRSEAAGTIKHVGPKLTVRTVLVALIKAYEIQGCYQMKNAFNAHGMDHVILVKLSSAAVVGWLLGLTEEQCKALVSHVWMDGAPSRVYRSGTDTVPRKGWAAGDACMRAVHLALLVQSGQPGSPGALTNARYGFLRLHRLGPKDSDESCFEFSKPFQSWVVRHVFFKVMPVEGHAVSAVEAALVHRQRLVKLLPNTTAHFFASRISKITVRITAAAHLIINKQGPLSNPADRDHCIQYIIALTLTKGAYPEVQDYADDSPYALSPELQMLRLKIEITADEKLTQDYLDLDIRSIGAGMTVFIDDGTILEEVLVEFPAGHMKNARTQKLLKAKFQKNMSFMFSAHEIGGIEETVLNDQFPVTHLVDKLARGYSIISARL